MLKVPELDNLSYEKMMSSIRSKVPLYTEEWTDLNEHDPGITILGTMAWLHDNLNYYINATGDIHRLKYLKLLGILPKKSAATCTVAINSTGRSILVPRGTKLAAGDIIFEFPETYREKTNNLTTVFMDIGGHFQNLSSKVIKSKISTTMFSYNQNEECALYFGFQDEIFGNKCLYFDVDTNPRRNFFDNNFSLSTLVWEIYDGEQWTKIIKVKDETCGFLKSGGIYFDKIPKSMPYKSNAQIGELHYIRGRIIENNYDVLPKLNTVISSCAKVCQTDTKAQSLEYYYDGNPIVIDYFVGNEDLVSVGVAGDDGISLWYMFGDNGDNLCDIITDKYDWRRKIVFDNDKYGTVPQIGQKIHVFVLDSTVYEKTILGLTTGCASQRMNLDFDGVCEITLALAGNKNGRPIYNIWNCCENITSAAVDDSTFAYDDKTKQIVFGDGINGVQPDSGLTVLAVTLKTSVFQSGNIRKSQLSNFVSYKSNNTQVENIHDANGGILEILPAQLEKKLESKLFLNTRAVNTEDYTNTAMATPGLMLDMINVVSSNGYHKYYHGEAKPYTVYIIAKPYSEQEKRPILSTVYIKAIKKHMEDYRIITTNIEVLPAKYLAVEVNGQIKLRENNSTNQLRIKKFLKDLISFGENQNFGHDIIYGKIFSQLEMHEVVERIDRLSFLSSGNGGSKNQQGDIVVYPDTLTYLGASDIEFI